MKMDELKLLIGLFLITPSLAITVTMLNNCGANLVFDDGGYLELSDSLSYPDNTDCQMNLTASSSANILIKFAWIDLEPGLVESQCFDYVTLSNIDGSTMESGANNSATTGGKTTEKLCGKVPPPDMTTFGDYATIKFESDASITKKGFALDFSAFTYEPCAGVTDFACGDGKCISSTLKCDSVNHCSNSYDESEEECAPKPINMIGPFTIGEFILLMSGCLFTLIILVLIFVRLINQKREKVLRSEILQNMNEDDPLFT